MKTNHSLESRLAGKFRMFTWLCLVLLIAAPFILHAQPPVATGDCGRNLLEFDGVDDEVAVSIPDFSYTSGTIEAWVRKDDWQDTEDDALFSNGIGHNTANSFYLSFHAGVGLHFRYGSLSQGGAAYADISTTNSLEPNSWHHVAATWTNNGSITFLVIYLDGSIVANTSIGNVVLTGSTTTFGISGAASGSHTVLQGGAIADMRVWNVARSSTEIANDMNSRLAGTETNLIAYWPLDDAAGSSTAANLVSTGSDGTLTNMDADTDWTSYPIEVRADGDRIGDSYDFGAAIYGYNTNTVVFTLVNHGASEISFVGGGEGESQPSPTGDNPNSFITTFSSMDWTLSPGESTTFYASFEPHTTQGLEQATLTFIESSGCSDPVSIHFTGTAGASLAYSGPGFTEAAANDGSVTGSITVTLSGDIFEAYDSEDYLEIDNEVTLYNIPEGLTPYVTLNSYTEAVLTLTGNATNHLSGNDVADITFAFSDVAFSMAAAVDVTNATGPASSGRGIDFISPSLTYTGAGFTEAAANDGSVTGAITITLTEDTFQDDDTDNLLDVGSELTINNIPGGLTPVVALNSPTEAVLTLLGNATDHQSAHDVGDITFAFADVAFTTFAATTVTNATGPASSSLGIDFASNPFLVYSGPGFTEATANDGSVTGSIDIDMAGDTFQDDDEDGFLEVGTQVTLGNVPAGLTPVVTLSSSSEAKLTLMGNATDHQSAHDVADITFAFADAAFTSSPATAVIGATGPASSGRGIDFASNPFLVYSGAGFTEAAANDGSVAGVIDIEMAGDAFQDDDEDGFIAVGTQVILGNVPAGLTPVVTLISSSEAKLTLTGNATGHLSMHSATDITFDFTDAAFVSGTASAVLGATGPASSNLGVTFIEIKELVYSGEGFTETAANDGSVEGYITVTLKDETFQDDDEDDLLDLNTEVAVYNYPPGLVPQFSLISPTEATFTFSGNANNHLNVDDWDELIFIFRDAAFTNSTAAQVTGATGFVPTGFSVDFVNNPTISYTGDGFTETEANDGAVEGSILIGLDFASFQDIDGDDLLDIGSEVTINNIPGGLTPSLEITANSQMGRDWEVPESVTMDYNAIAYGNGIYVAVGSDGTDRMATSTDGITWTVNSAHDDKVWSDVVFAQGIFVALPQSGSNLVYTSFNGLNWTGRAPSSELGAGSENGWAKLAHGRGIFMAVRTNGDNKVLKSEDGINWTLLPGNDEMGTFLGYGKGLFVSGRSDGNISVSHDEGVTWTTTAFEEDIYYGMNDITYGNGTFVISSLYSYVDNDENNNLILTSSDGLNWTPRAVEQGEWTSVAFGNGVFVAVGNTGTNRVITSADGVAWTPVAVPEERWHDVIFEDEKFTAITRTVGNVGVMHSNTQARARLTLSGNAANHDRASKVSDITFEFSDGAFEGETAPNIANATGPASSGLGVVFDPIANDDCADAIPLTVYPEGEGDFTMGSTEFVGVFEGSLDCAEGGAVNDVWYKVNLGQTGSVMIDLSLGTASNLSVAVYTACGSEAVYCTSDVHMLDKLYLPVGSDMDVYLQAWSTEAGAGTFSFRVQQAPTTLHWHPLPGLYWTGGAPGEEDDALLLAPYNTEDEGALEVNNLDVYFDGVIYAGELTIADGDAVTVNGDLTNNGGLHVASGGSLVTYGEVTTREVEEVEVEETMFLLGSFFERNTTFDNSTGRYSIVGSPVEEGSFDSLGSGAVVYAYDESAPYNPSGNQGLHRFVTPAQLELIGMTPGEGYFSAFTGDENGTVVFTGTPNHGTVAVDLSYTDQGSTEEEPFEGFNLVSNPYPAAISVAEFLSVNSTLDMDQVVYIWDDFGSDTGRGTNADYLVVNSLGNTGTNSRGDGEERFDGYIRSVQGFFVKANSTGQALQFTDAMKVADNNSDAGYFRKSSATKYKLVLSNEVGSQATIIGYVSDAALEKDKAYDALHMGAGDLQVYSLMPGEGQKLAIQGLPVGYTGEVPLGFTTSQNTTHTIGLMNQSDISGAVWLLDRLTGIATDLSVEAYTFTTVPGVFENRFVLKPTSVLSTEEAGSFVYAYDNTLYIRSTNPEPVAYQVFNLSGKKVKTVIAAGKSQFDLSYMQSGVYLVSNGLESKKIILK